VHTSKGYTDEAVFAPCFASDEAAANVDACNAAFTTYNNDLTEAHDGGSFVDRSLGDTCRAMTFMLACGMAEQCAQADDYTGICSPMALLREACYHDVEMRVMATCHDFARVCEIQLPSMDVSPIDACNIPYFDAGYTSITLVSLILPDMCTELDDVLAGVDATTAALGQWQEAIDPCTRCRQRGKYDEPLLSFAAVCQKLRLLCDDGGVEASCANADKYCATLQTSCDAATATGHGAAFHGICKDPRIRIAAGMSISINTGNDEADGASFINVVDDGIVSGAAAKSPLAALVLAVCVVATLSLLS
jgi:hypothetical protein